LIKLSPTLLDGLVDVALANVAREYPFHIVHMAESDADLAPPRTLYPAFFGSYDWHSCVHMHWTLVRSLSLAPDAPFVPRIVSHLDERLSPTRLAEEVRYFEGPRHKVFERPYGWAWLLLLSAEVEALARRGEARARPWSDALAPLAGLLRERLLEWLPRAEFPTRAGVHSNSAFALVLASSFASTYADTTLESALVDTARRWYGGDLTYPAEYEPSGDDFLSGGLVEALAMQRLVPEPEFETWWRGFEPGSRGLRRWCEPVIASDPTDPKIVHLFGLDLSRAWCWRELAPHLPTGVRDLAKRAAEAHVEVALDAATSGDYAGTHWLASFVLLALTGDRARV